MSDCVFVSSRGLLKSCNVHEVTPISDNPRLDCHRLFTQIGACAHICPTVYICTAALPQFIRHITALPKSIILVTGDSDVACTDIDYMRIIASDKVVHWFAQNCDLPTKYSHKVTAMPIGLDYHTLAQAETGHSWGSKQTPKQQDTTLQIIKKKPVSERKQSCYANFQFFTKSRYGYLRLQAIQDLNKTLTYYEPCTTSRIVSWVHQLEYAFVISPPGNGLDCHRTWEALALGCIAITQKNPNDKGQTLLDLLYNSLPILTVHSYSDITAQLLGIGLTERSCVSSEKLQLSYWTSQWEAIQRVYETTTGVINSCPELNSLVDINTANTVNTMIKHTAVLGLCVYQNAAGLPYVCRNILLLEKLFNLTVVVYYNESTTGPAAGGLASLSVLLNRGTKIQLINGELVNLQLERTARIATARNGILNYIRNLGEKPEYFMMMDSNDYSCVGEIDISVLMTVLEHVPNQDTPDSQPDNKYDWTALSFDRADGYYDTWALSYDPFVYSFFHYKNWQRVVELMRADFNKRLQAHRDSGTWMPVYSAFNGFALYKTRYYINSNYSNLIDTTLFPATLIDKQSTLVQDKPMPVVNNDCEHRAFHLAARGNMYICPKYLFRVSLNDKSLDKKVRS